MKNSVYAIILTIFCVITGYAQDFKTLEQQIRDAIATDNVEYADSLIDQALAKAKLDLPTQDKWNGIYMADKGALAFRARNYVKTINWATQAEQVFDKNMPDSIAIENLLRLSMALLETDEMAIADEKLQKAEHLLATIPNTEKR